jgi:hypothetical protein
MILILAHCPFPPPRREDHREADIIGSSNMLQGLPLCRRIQAGRPEGSVDWMNFSAIGAAPRLTIQEFATCNKREDHSHISPSHIAPALQIVCFTNLIQDRCFSCRMQGCAGGILERKCESGGHSASEFFQVNIPLNSSTHRAKTHK